MSDIFCSPDQTKKSIIFAAKLVGISASLGVIVGILLILLGFK